MKLEEFLCYINNNRKNKMQCEKIADEFKLKGYENFLFLSYAEESSIHGNIAAAIKNLPPLNSNQRIYSYFNPILKSIELPIDSIDNMYTVFFRYSPSKAYYLASELAAKADKHEILPNLFEDDPSINHIVSFKKERIQDLALMLDIISPTASSDGVVGYAIYGVDLIYITNLCSYNGKPTLFPKPNSLTHYCGNMFRRDNNPFKIKHTRETIEQIMLKNVFPSELEMAFYLREELMNRIQSQYQRIRELIKDGYENGQLNQSELKEKKDEIFNKLVKENRIPTKWKSEKELFDLVFNYFQDAVFQYSPEWLAPQSFDVFVPSIQTAFEYQGIQHYKAINFFGGEKSFKHRQELDQRKKEISLKNKVHLIEWHFEDTITKQVLKEKLRNIGINIK